MILVDILKYYLNWLYDLYLKIFKFLLREHEYEKGKTRLSGATWLIISDVICIIFFPRDIAITGMLLLSISDSASTIFGRYFGKKMYAKNRTYIGSASFIISGCLIILITPKVNYSLTEYAIGFVTVFLTALVDGSNFPFDDNFTIPIFSSLILYFFYSVLI